MRLLETTYTAITRYQLDTHSARPATIEAMHSNTFDIDYCSHSAIDISTLIGTVH